MVISSGFSDAALVGAASSRLFQAIFVSVPLDLRSANEDLFGRATIDPCESWFVADLPAAATVDRNHVCRAVEIVSPGGIN
jgi:hypothetical protein